MSTRRSVSVASAAALAGLCRLQAPSPLPRARRDIRIFDAHWMRCAQQGMDLEHADHDLVAIAWKRWKPSTVLLSSFVWP